MTPLEITAVGAAGAVVIGAIAGGIVTVMNGWRALAGNVSAIAGHVNSEKTAADGREIALRRENDLLREINADQKASAALLAQASATRVADTEH